MTDWTHIGDQEQGPGARCCFTWSEMQVTIKLVPFLTRCVHTGTLHWGAIIPERRVPRWLWLGHSRTLCWPRDICPIQDHWGHPRQMGKAPDPSCKYSVINPTCFAWRAKLVPSSHQALDQIILSLHSLCVGVDASYCVTQTQCHSSTLGWQTSNCMKPSNLHNLLSHTSKTCNHF